MPQIANYCIICSEFCVVLSVSAYISSMTTVINEKSSSKCFGGYQKVYTHKSKELNCSMNFAVYLPPQAESEKCPVIYYLSGLTCTEQNFIQKAGAQRFASEHGLIIVTCDTSPRGCNIPGEDEKWNIGTGAGYYVNTTQEPWSKHYRMYSYIISELPAIIEEHFPVLPDKQSIMGHSMGGHGAFLCALRNPGMFKSVSAFAPVCDSARCRPFIEGFKLYFGGEPEDGTWDEWNATKLVQKYSGPPLQILIDQGTNDEFLSDLYPTDFTEACATSGVSVILNMRDGYDHGYYFISSFIKDHIEYHVKFLKQ